MLVDEETNVYKARFASLKSGSVPSILFPHFSALKQLEREREMWEALKSSHLKAKQSLDHDGICPAAFVFAPCKQI